MQQRTLKHNAQLKKKSFFSLKMWKTVIQGQNHTKHKVEPSLNLDFFYFSWKRGKETIESWNRLKP